MGDIMELIEHVMITINNISSLISLPTTQQSAGNIDKPQYNDAIKDPSFNSPKRPIFPLEADKAAALAKQIAQTGKYDPQEIKKAVDWIVGNIWNDLPEEGRQVIAYIRTGLISSPPSSPAEMEHLLNLLAHYCNPIKYPNPKGNPAGADPGVTGNITLASRLAQRV